MKLTRRKFKALFEEQYPVLLNTAYRVTRDRSSAEDVVQIVFENLWNKRRTVQLNDAPAYLRRSAVNRAINFVKKRNRLDQADALEDKHDANPSPLQYAEYKELEEWIHAHIDALPERCRLIFVLSRFESLKNKEIADQLDISIKTVENQMSKALRILKKALEIYRNGNKISN